MGLKWSDLDPQTRAVLGHWQSTKKPRKKVGTGVVSDYKRWELAMRQLPGVFIPMRIMSEANMREHHMKKANRKKNQRAMIGLLAKAYVRMFGPPMVVTLTRYGPRLWDDDNNVSGFKTVRDEISKIVGIDDGQTSLIKFECKQEPSKHYGVRVVIDKMEGV